MAAGVMSGGSVLRFLNMEKMVIRVAGNVNRLAVSTGISCSFSLAFVV
jgi:hypothetical protein